MKKEILKKSKFLTAETMDVLTGGHFSTYHSGLTRKELEKRGKTTASSFFSMADITIALQAAFSDELNAEAIEKAVKAERRQRDEIPFFSDTILGQALIDGELVSCSCGNVVIGYRDKDYRNKVTGMPFEIITITLDE